MSTSERRPTGVPSEFIATTTAPVLPTGAGGSRFSAEAREGQNGGALRRMILAHHRELLERSGIPVNFAVDLGVRSVISAADLPESLQIHRGSGQITPGLLFPWRGADGVIDYQLRPDEPLPVAEASPESTCRAVRFIS